MRLIQRSTGLKKTGELRRKMRDIQPWLRSLHSEHSERNGGLYMFACWSTRLVILASLLLPPANLGQAQEKKVTVPLAGCGKRDDATWVLSGLPRFV